MDEQRIQAYLNLIDQLLTRPNSEEAEILNANSNLVDAELLREMERAAEQLIANRNQNAANFLRSLSSQRVEARGISETSTPAGSPSPNYQQFWIEVLLATADSKGNREVIYPLLQANPDKLDNNSIAVLQNWAELTFSQVDSSTAKDIANVIIYFSNRIQEFPLGSKATNLEISIAGYEISLTVLTRDSHPENWALIQNNLGTAYLYRISGDKADNLERAIAAYQNALQVRTKEALPIDWAMTQNNLGNAYWDRISGDGAENLERAIAAYQKALQVYTREALPIQWATTQNNLGIAYSNRIFGDRADNLEVAIAAFGRALQVRTREALPVDWAMTQNNLGLAYCDRISGNGAENLELAIATFQQALQVRTREAFPIQWAMTRNNLGDAYWDRIAGDRAENLELAIAAYQQALQVYTREALPIQWSDTQNNFGNAYSQRILGDGAENLERAIAAYEKALQVRTREALPIQWAMTQNNLGNAYSDRISGDRTDNLERAIAAYQQALQVRTLEANPINHLQTTRNLGNLYFAQGSWQNAIAAYEKATAALELSRSWATTDEHRQQIMARAIDVYQKQVQAHINIGQWDKAIETVERSKARVLVRLLTNRDLYPKGDVPRETIAQLDGLRRSIPSLERQLQVVIDRLSGNTGEPEAPQRRSLETLQQQLRLQLQSSRQQLDEVLQQIKPIDPGFSLTERVERMPFGDIQSLVGDRAALIEWYITEDTILTFIVTRYGRHPIVVSSPAKNLKSLENWDRDYINAYREQKSQWIADLSTRLADLAQILDIDRILSQIDAIFDKQGVKCDRLILVPHRSLHLFPLHALPLSNSNGDLLLDRFERGVSYAPSSQLLKLTKGQHRPHFNNLFAIQNPTRPDEKPLLGSKLEVERIRQYFDPNRSIVLAEAAATEAQLNQKNEQLRSAHCLHFSCHGKFNFASPLESALLLSDPEGTLKEDADLTLYKIFKLDLGQCRIVGFSACESGMTLASNNDENGGFPSGLDEYIGLPSGFLYAGSPGVVSTLWTVDPLATALLVIKFYQYLKRLPKLEDGDVSTALVKAQFWLRTLSSKTLARIQKSQKFERLMAQIFENSKRDRRKFNDLLYAAIKRQPYPFARPYYWAASVAIGT